MKILLPTLLLGFLASSAFADDRVAAANAAFETQIENQAGAWFDDGEYPILIEFSKFRLEMHPGAYERVTDLGWMYKNIERPDLEWDTYSAFQRDFPQDPDSSFPLGSYYYFAKSYTQVVVTLRHSVDMTLHPQPNSFRLLAHSYTRLGMYKESLAVWDKYIKLAPGDLAAKVNRTKVQDRLDGKTVVPETADSAGGLQPATVPRRKKP